MKLKPNDFRKIVVGSFLAVPALSSLISTMHIVEFFGLGNQTWMAIILALAFEIGSIASLMTLAVLDKINRFAVWFIFGVLLAMQMLGNVYYTYNFISIAMNGNPMWIQSFVDLVEMMTMQKLEPRTTKFILSLLIGLPIPVISLAFLKSVSDYLKPENKEESKKIEEVKSQKKNEEKVAEVEEPFKEESKEVVEVQEEEKTEEDLIGEEPQGEKVGESTVDEPLVKETEEIIEEQEEQKSEETIVEETKEVIEVQEEIKVEKTQGESVEQEPVKIDTTIRTREEESFDIYDEDENQVAEVFFDSETETEKFDGFQSEEDSDDKKN